MDDDPSGIGAFLSSAMAGTVKYVTLSIVAVVAIWVMLRAVFAVVSWAFWL